jgi:hypothetical protein
MIRALDYIAFTFAFTLLMAASVCAIALTLLVVALALPAMKLFRVVRLSAAARARLDGHHPSAVTLPRKLDPVRISATAVATASGSPGLCLYAA